MHYLRSAHAFISDIAVGLQNTFKLSQKLSRGRRARVPDESRRLRPLEDYGASKTTAPPGMPYC